MRVLVACEEWGRVRDAFAMRGHDAWSCDFKPSKSPGQHHQGDVRDIIGDRWDLMVAHPVCKYLTNSGVRWLYVGGRRWNKDGTENPIDLARWKLMEDGCEFFNLFVNAHHIPRRCIENPKMHHYAAERCGNPTQYVQPYDFGDPYTKETGLRLIGLPELVATHKKENYPEIIAECHLMGPGPERESLRSRTYPGIANALASQFTACMADSHRLVAV